jgi:hypothetical protein
MGVCRRRPGTASLLEPPWESPVTELPPRFHFVDRDSTITDSTKRWSRCEDLLVLTTFVFHTISRTCVAIGFLLTSATELQQYDVLEWPSFWSTISFLLSQAKSASDSGCTDLLAHEEPGGSLVLRRIGDPVSLLLGP